MIWYYPRMRVLLYYKYVDIADPAAEVLAQRAIATELQLKGRILISNEGINGTCSGTPDAIEAYKKFCKGHPLFSDIAFKESESEVHPFQKLFVRLRPEVVTLRQNVSAKEAAPYITATELHQALSDKEDLVLIDMRNDYEAAIGRFRNAVTLTMENFRDLPKFLAQLEQYKDKKVITYCTGGIRCERASALLRTNGFTDVRQLEGGIVTYMEKYPDGFFDGSCFVFDDRMSIRFPGKLAPSYISKCAECGCPSDRYIDCSDVGCHELFICCEGCEKKNRGLCSAHVAGPHPRPFSIAAQI